MAIVSVGGDGYKLCAGALFALYFDAAAGATVARADARSFAAARGRDAAAGEADVYLSSANALTKSGQIINVDGHGNRVAATLHGPGRVIFVVGKNKIVENYDDGIARIKNVVSPANAKRMNLDTPCAKTGKCMDCRGKQRICNATVVLEQPMIGLPVDVILVNEDLGY